MKEINVTVDAKDKKKVMMDCTVAGLSRYVSAHDEYDDINYRVNTFAKKELQKIFNHVNTDEGKKQLMFCEEQEVKYKLNRQNLKRPVVEIKNASNEWFNNSIITPNIPLSSSTNIHAPSFSYPRIDPKEKRMNEMLEWVNSLPGLLMLNQVQSDALMKSFNDFSKTQ